ncbi:MAG TPA: CpsB/CapC family capsule biosynthesis tyrosine phosphatase [Candidatus Polarisedimenticolia bacterium]|jgi:protein-tyrosine phosphatase
MFGDYIDIHSHVLPGIDDGSRSLEESIELCRISAQDGVKVLVCTPHVDFRYTNRRGTIEGPFGLVRDAVRQAGIDLDLIRGAEVHLAPDILVRLREKDLLTYDDKGRYLLLEFPFQQVIMGAEDMVYRLRLAGVTPVIAHPERIGWFMDDPDRLCKLVRLGALGQVTGGSLMGQFGEKSQRVGLTMVERNLVHVVASDAHDTSYRRPVLAEVARQVARQFGGARARTMFVDHPGAIVAGVEIERPEPIEAPRRFRGFLSSLFSRSRA